MVKLSVRITSQEGESYTDHKELPEEFIISKQNQELQNLVRAWCDKTGFEHIDDVKITAKFEW